ncbi:hypothetical protein O9992_24330 [Vibrio lentus]|nr:hypothetical protein [Vibrio lentus]
MTAFVVQVLVTPFSAKPATMPAIASDTGWSASGTAQLRRFSN